jgi:hypothetical protein
VANEIALPANDRRWTKDDERAALVEAAREHHEQQPVETPRAPRMQTAFGYHRQLTAKEQNFSKKRNIRASSESAGAACA